MAKRRSSGFLETLFKSVLGVGSTVRYKKDFWGHSQKIVTYHDSGKEKTYSHGHGIFGDVTKTTTRKGGTVTETGKLRKNLLFGATEHSTRTDGTEVKRSYKPGIFRDHVATHVVGECWSCEGSGIFKGTCKTCSGTGRFRIAAKPCFTCNGSGVIQGNRCAKCNGTGQFKPPIELPCRRCSGTGSFTGTCNKCGGTGRHERSHYT